MTIGKDTKGLGMPWEADYGYAQAVKVGDTIFVSGQLKLAIYEDLVRSTAGHSKAAEWLGLDPKALHHRIRRLRQQLARKS